MHIHTYEVQFVEHGHSRETTVHIDASSAEEARSLVAAAGIVGRVQLSRIRLSDERRILSRLDDIQMQLAKVTRGGIIVSPIKTIGLGIWWAWLLGMAAVLTIWIVLTLLVFLGVSISKSWPTPAPVPQQRAR